MPNGGSDCCGTCWFNAKNKGQAGFGHADDPEPHFCVIRGIAIEDAFYTYCANHPHRSPERNPVPIGPVYTGDCSGNRKVWRVLEDSPENREGHLGLLRALSEVTPDEYPIGKSTLAIIIEQLAAWGEARAIPLLQRVANRPQDDSSPDWIAYPRNLNIEAARRALKSLQGKSRR